LIASGIWLMSAIGVQGGLLVILRRRGVLSFVKRHLLAGAGGATVAVAGSLAPPSPTAWIAVCFVVYFGWQLFVDGVRQKSLSLRALRLLINRPTHLPADDLADMIREEFAMRAHSLVTSGWANHEASGFRIATRRDNHDGILRHIERLERLLNIETLDNRY